MNLITSLDNPHVKNWCKLKSKKYRDKENLFLVEGEHLVLEALKASKVKEVILDEEMVFPVDVPKYYVTKEILRKITLLKSPPSIIAVVAKLEEKPYQNKLLLLDSLQDPGNLGTIIRSAAAFDIDTIILSDDTVDLYNEKVIRATQGLIFHINILRRNLKDIIKDLKKQNYVIYGTNVEHGKRVKEITLKEKYALIMGNEGQGVSKDLLSMCNDYIYIPMNEVCESLNVGVATSIILYEFYKKDGYDEK